MQNEGYLPDNIKLPSKGCSLDNASVTITVTNLSNGQKKYNYKYNPVNDCN